MGEILSRPPASSFKVPHASSILVPPVKVEAYVPQSVSTRKRKSKSKVLEVVGILNQNPGVWYKVAIGKLYTVNGVKLRMCALDNTLLVDQREENGQNVLFAMAPEVY